MQGCLAIQGGWVVAWGDGGHQVLDGGTVVMEGNRIIFVGFPDDPGCPQAEKVIDARGKLISPGLINLHCIANLDAQVLGIDGSPQGGSPRQTLSYLTNPAVPNMFSDADFRASADFSVATLLKAGNTSYCRVTGMPNTRWEDPLEQSYALVEASERMGARSWLANYYRQGCDYTDSNGKHGIMWDRSKAEAGLDHAIDLIKQIQKMDNSRLNGFLFPSRTDRCSDDILKETIRQSKLLGVHVRSHFSEYLNEYHEFKSKVENKERTMVEWLSDIGFLGPQVCLTHALYIAGHSATGAPAGEDLAILARSGTSVGHCPVVFARGGTAMESLSRYVEAGVNVGLGTDTFPPDLVEEMRIGALINKVVDRKRSAGTVREFYNAATIGGAKALGRDDLGRLAAGCTADISIFNLPELEAGPIDDPMRTFVHFCHGWDCDMVIVDGNVVVEDGSVVGVDEEDLASRAQQSWGNYRTGIADRDQAGRSVDELFPPAFPIVRQ